MIKRLASESSISLEEKRQMLESWLNDRKSGTIHSLKTKASDKYTNLLESQLNTVFERITRK